MQHLVYRSDKCQSRSQWNRHCNSLSLWRVPRRLRKCHGLRKQRQPFTLRNRVIQDHSIPRLYNHTQPILPNSQKRLHHNIYDSGNRNKRLQQHCRSNSHRRNRHTPWSRNLSTLLGRPLFHFNPHCLNSTQHATRHVHDHGDRHQRITHAHLYRDRDGYKLDPRPPKPT